MTLQLHLTTLLIAAVAAAAALIAVWAATSPRHWFWRAIAIWAFVAAMLPIRAYDPAMVFAISLPLVVLVIRGLIWISERGHANQVAVSHHVSAFRFGLIDVLLAMAILGLALAAMLHIARNLDAREFRPRTASEIILPAVAVVVVTALCWCLVWGGRRRWVAVGLIVAIPVLGYFLWSELPWLLLLDPQFNFYYVMPTNDLERRAFLLAMLALTEFAGLFVVRLAAVRYAPSSIHRRGLWLTVRLASFAVLVVGVGLLYVQMLRLDPYPPSLVPSENNYARIRQIAERVKSLNESSIPTADLEPGEPEVAEELSGLYRELLVLLEAPNALPDDLSTVDWRIDDRTSPDWFRTMRVLSRSLVAESQSVAGSKDMEQAVELALADVRLGTMLCRNAIMIDTLIGLAVLNHGGKQLATLRDTVDLATSRRIGDVLHSLESTLETESTVILRDLAYCDRAYGWQARFMNIVEGVAGPSPESQDSARSFVDGVNRWRAISRLLQTDLALRRHRDQQGSYPTTLAELAPDELSVLPLDPFTQRPLVYRAAGGELTLYSVGRDRRDDGGRFGNASESLQEGYDFDLDTLTRP